MQHIQLTWVRLPLQKAYNVRDLGGLPTQDGGQTRWGAFLRADDIAELSGRDVTFLLEYGVRTVIDLRCSSEVDERPDRLNRDNGVVNFNISFMDETDLSPAGIQKMAEMNMGDMYIEMLMRLPCTDTLRRAFEVIAGAEPGCILFHCAAGKDRTGVLAMLLLMLAGVDKQDCVNNYSQSYQNLLRNEKYLPDNEDNLFRHMLESRAEYISMAYDYVQNQGGIAAYLAGCGVPQAIIGAVKERLATKALVHQEQPVLSA